MPGEIYQIKCSCGVQGSVSFGLSHIDILDRLSKGAERKEKHRYITIDHKLEIIELESETDFLPNTPWIIPEDIIEQFVNDEHEITCPNCDSSWKVVGVKNFS